MGTDEGIRMLVKTLFFYIAITLEAFIFCFAGEYLSNKVSTWDYLSVFSFSAQGCKKRSLNCVTDKRLDQLGEIAHVNTKHLIMRAESDISFFHLLFIRIFRAE